MKYKVGDIVKLRDDLELRTYDGNHYCNYIMTTFKGQKATIARVSKTKSYYTIEEDYRAHCWTDEMIEGLWEECKSSEQVSKSEGKYKLIDILNKIANGELKEGTKVNLIADDYLTKLYYDGELIRFVASDNIYAFTCKDINDEDEYELIEPECISDKGKTLEATDNTKIEELDKEEMLCLTLQCAIAVLTDKLNEVIRYINK